MSLPARTTKSSLAFAAIVACTLAAAAEAPKAEAPQVITTTTAFPAGRLPLVENESWIFRLEVPGEAPSRIEVTTMFQSRNGDWSLAVRDPDAAPPPNAAAARAIGPIDHRGAACIVDWLTGLRLQALPCTPPVAGDTWTIKEPGAMTRRDFKAIGKETVTVPLGRFAAFRIEETEVAELVTSTGTRKGATIARNVYWIAPEAAGVVRAEQQQLRADGTVARSETRALESFGAPSEAARLAFKTTATWQAHERALAAQARIVAVFKAMPPLSRKAVVSVDAICKPEYPPAAIRAGVTGETRVALAVAADGSVTDAVVFAESGLTREHRLLDAAAQAALSKCTFQPALAKDGTPVASVTVISYAWKLD